LRKLEWWELESKSITEKTFEGLFPTGNIWDFYFYVFVTIFVTKKYFEIINTILTKSVSCQKKKKYYHIFLWKFLEKIFSPQFSFKKNTIPFVIAPKSHAFLYLLGYSKNSILIGATYKSPYFTYFDFCLIQINWTIRLGRNV